MPLFEPAELTRQRTEWACRLLLLGVCDGFQVHAAMSVPHFTHDRAAPHSKLPLDAHRAQRSRIVPPATEINGPGSKPSCDHCSYPPVEWVLTGCLLTWLAHDHKTVHTSNYHDTCFFDGGSVKTHCPATISLLKISHRNKAVETH
jgi:hypothetical protein